VTTTVSVPSDVTLLVGTGLCGTFTTYSAFAYETFRLVENDRWLHALGNLAASVTGGLGAALIGYALGTLL
ncbi:MAG: fluoride efflux transporter FluC, partial [Actinomycetes bacterium]